MFAVFDQIYLKDIWRLNICIPPIPSYNSQSHILLTHVTCYVSARVAGLSAVLEAFCLYSERRGEHEKCLWLNIHPHVHHMYTSMYIHAGTQKFGDIECRPWPGQIINAASQNQAGSNARISTHLKLTVHVCQTFITCHRTQSLYLFFRSYPSLKSQSICLFWENMWEAGRVKGWERLFD